MSMSKKNMSPNDVLAIAITLGLGIVLLVGVGTAIAMGCMIIFH